MKTPTLETERLILRPISLDDAPAVQKYFNNWKIIQNLSLGVPWPYPDDGAETFIKNVALKKMNEQTGIVWALKLKAAPEETVGMIDFSFEDNAEQGNRGFWLAEHLQGQGLMSEAITATQDFLFFEHGMEKFIVTNVKTNEASRKVKQKTGAKFIGMQKLMHHNGIDDSELWEVTSENWTKIRGRSID